MQSSMEPQASSPRTTRPRGNTGFSVTSAQSDRTSRSKELKQRESHDQKNHLSETTKANPNAAMTEMQPMQQQLAESTMVSLRGGQYTDMNGVLITDPDFSNPTRHRGERPLATIRSFEAAIDSEWKRSRGDRPESMMRNDSAPEGYDFSSRRSSAYWGTCDVATPFTSLAICPVTGALLGPYHLYGRRLPARKTQGRKVRSHRLLGPRPLERQPEEMKAVQLNIVISKANLAKKTKLSTSHVKPLR